MHPMLLPHAAFNETTLFEYRETKIDIEVMGTHDGVFFAVFLSM